MNIFKIIKNWWLAVCEVSLFENILLSLFIVCLIRAFFKTDKFFAVIMYIALWVCSMTIMSKEIKDKKNVQQKSHK